MRPEDSEVVVFVGITVDNPAFKGLPKRDQDYIADLTHVQSTGLRPILRHGNIVGYGIPLIIADAQHEFSEVDFTTLYERIEVARAAFTNLMRRVAVPFEAKCYAPKLHHAVQAIA